MLDDEQRIARLLQAFHDVDHASHVARVQADRRLVQHEQRIDERRPERSRQVDPLHFAARERARLPIERQVAETDVEQELQAAADLSQHEIAGLIERRGQHEPLEERGATLDRQQHQLVNADACQARQGVGSPARAARREARRLGQYRRRVLLCSKSPQQRVGFQTRAAASGTGRVRSILREQHADVHLVRLGLEPREEAPHAVPELVFPAAFAFQHPLAMLRAQLTPWRIERHAALAREAHQIVLAFAIRLRLPRPHDAAAQRFRLVGHDEAEVDADDPAEAAATFAGAERRIEREQARRRLAVVDVAIGTVQVGGEAPDARGALRVVEHVDRDTAAADAQRRLQRFDHTVAIDAGETHTVLDHFQDDTASAVRRRCARRSPLALACGALSRGTILRLATREHARVTLLLQQTEHFGFAEVVRHRHRKSHHEPAIAQTLGCQSLVDLAVNALRRVPPYRCAAIAAVQLGGTREQQLQVIVELRHGADGRARGAHRIGLVDGDCRRNAFDALDLRAIHAVEELPRIRRERLDVAALTFRVDRVEHERRLPRARHAGDDDQLVRRQIEIEVLQIVLTRAADDDGMGHGAIGRWGPH